MTCLVTGATGLIGSLVVERLLARGERPSVLVRDATKASALYGNRVDVFVGDLSNATTLLAPLSRVDAVLLINAGPELAARDEAAAHVAKAAGVGHLVKLSSFDARLNVGTGVWHARGEAAIRASGVPFTFVQPSGFMTNALFWASSIKKDGIVRAATGAGRIAFVHPVDIADVITKTLATRDYNSGSLAITGPAALNYAEMAAKIGSVIGRHIGFETISDEEAHRHQLVSGESEPVIQAHLSIFRAIREGRLSAVTDTVECVLNRKPIAFERWIEENVTAFR